MKKKQATKNSEIQVPTAYNINKEIQDAAGQGFPAAKVIFWADGDRLGFSLGEQTVSLETLHEPTLIARHWLTEAKLSLAYANVRTPEPTQFISGIVYFAGDKWRPWKPAEIQYGLGIEVYPINVRPFPFQPGAQMIGWSTHLPKTQCRKLAATWVVRIASLYNLAVKIFPDFEATFSVTPNLNSSFSRDSVLSTSLISARNLVFDVIRHVDEHHIQQSGEDADDLKARLKSEHYLNGGSMLLQGFRIGQSIAECEALIFTHDWAIRAAAPKRKRDVKSKSLWRWICTNPKFSQLKPEELFEILGKVECPVYEDKKLIVSGAELCEPSGDGKTSELIMTWNSFRASLGRHKKRHAPPSE